MLTSRMKKHLYDSGIHIEDLNRKYNSDFLACTSFFSKKDGIIHISGYFKIDVNSDMNENLFDSNEEDF